MSPGRDTEPTPLGDDPPGRVAAEVEARAAEQPRSKRESISIRTAFRRVVVAILSAVARGIDKHSDRIALALVTVALAGIALWQVKMSGTVTDAEATATDAKAAAAAATAQGTVGQVAATEAKVEQQETYHVTKANAASTTELIAKVNELTAKVEKLEAAKAKRARRRPCSPTNQTPGCIPVIKTPPVLKAAPESPAAAREQAAAPAPGGPP